MYPVHESESGSFQELARSDDVKFGQLSYLVINPRCSRGGHYHKRKEEWFCCIHGRCRMDLLDVKTKLKKELILDGSMRAFVKIAPCKIHTVTNIDPEKVCELAIIISEEYNESDPDTFKPTETW